MTIERIRHIIHGDSPGKTTEMNSFRIGRFGSKTKAYLQGALHTDEQPGIMALHHLVKLLMEADANNLLEGEFVIFPMVNPIGMGNIGFGMHQGRYDIPSGVNFNRDWPDVFKFIEQRIDGRLGSNEEENKMTIINAIDHWLSTRQVTTARDQHRQVVLKEAFNAQYVFDLHCDDDSLVHIFCGEHHTETMHRLANHVNAAATLTAGDSGGGSFDEVFPLTWSRIQEAHPSLPIPQFVAGCTIEFRGQADVFDELGETDAKGIFNFFQAEGMISGDTNSTVKKTPEPTPLNATEVLRVAESGLLAYKVKLGDFVKKGDCIAELIALSGENAFIQRKPICAGTDGLVISRNIRKYVWPGCSIAKIVGTEPLASREGYLLED